MRRGSPTTICRTPYSRTIRSRAARSCRLFRRCKVSSPCAVMPRGSETAIPILLDPTSKPRTLPVGYSLLGSGVGSVADACPGLNSKGEASMRDLGLWELKPAIIDVGLRSPVFGLFCRRRLDLKSFNNSRLRTPRRLRRDFCALTLWLAATPPPSASIAFRPNSG